MLVVGAVGLCVLALVAGALARTGPGQIGGPPTRPVDPPPEERQSSPARIVGVGRDYSGWVEIVAYGTEGEPESPSQGDGFCVWLEYGKFRFPSFGSCLAAGPIERTIAIEDTTQLISPKRFRFSEFAGALSPDVARVVVEYRRNGNGKTYRTQATVAQVSGTLQNELDQPAPFGYFAAKVRGLIRTKDARALAYNSAGDLIGSTRGLSSPGIPVPISPPQVN